MRRAPGGTVVSSSRSVRRVRGFCVCCKTASTAPSAKLSRKAPTASLVKLDELVKRLPEGEAEISAEEREEQIALRRRYVQRRFGF